VGAPTSLPDAIRTTALNDRNRRPDIGLAPNHVAVVRLDPPIEIVKPLLNEIAKSELLARCCLTGC
jgi:hypothetical protein